MIFDRRIVISCGGKELYERQYNKMDLADGTVLEESLEKIKIGRDHDYVVTYECIKPVEASVELGNGAGVPLA